MFFALKIIWIHFIADFVLQPRFVSNNKKDSLLVLLLHIVIYCAFFTLFFFRMPHFVLLLGVTHFIIEFVSSKLYDRFTREKKYYYFFLLVGLDQALHLTSIFLLHAYLSKLL
jgi:hypothetical protein